jgi:hypothetical protein
LRRGPSRRPAAQGTEATQRSTAAQGTGNAQTGATQRFVGQESQRQTSGGQGVGAGKRRESTAGKRKKAKFHQSAPPPKPKPIVPLTKAMKEGKAPLRTFGDLLQFMALKRDETASEGETAES